MLYTLRFGSNSDKNKNNGHCTLRPRLRSWENVSLQLRECVRYEVRVEAGKLTTGHDRSQGRVLKV
jgi:hypothetical protein